MDKKKEGVISSVPEAIAEAAKINIAATKETATSAVTSFVDTVIGREKPRRGKRRVPKKKSSSASSTTKRSASGRTAAKSLFARVVKRGGEVLPQNRVDAQRAARVEDLG